MSYEIIKISDSTMAASTKKIDAEVLNYIQNVFLSTNYTFKNFWMSRLIQKNRDIFSYIEFVEEDLPILTFQSKNKIYCNIAPSKNLTSRELYANVVHSLAYYCTTKYGNVIFLRKPATDFLLMIFKTMFKIVYEESFKLGAVGGAFYIYVCKNIFDYKSLNPGEVKSYVSNFTTDSDIVIDYLFSYGDIKTMDDVYNIMKDVKLKKPSNVEFLANYMRRFQNILTVPMFEDPAYLVANVVSSQISNSLISSAFSKIDRANFKALDNHARNIVGYVL